MKEKKNYSINIKGELCDFSTPWVIGIVNATPDSFYPGSRVFRADAIRERVRSMRVAGARGVDIGGYSTRSGASEVSADEEYRRLAMALQVVAEEWPEAVVSVDTFRADVARRCVEDWNVDTINDISGGDMDSRMFETVADLGVSYVLMHTRGTPATMQSLTDYRDVTAEVISDLAAKAARLNRLGVKDILIDPGFGFAKTVEQNYELMSRLDDFRDMGYPLYVGVSRKSMIFRLLDITPAEGLNGTTVLNTFALLHGADVLRVHDVEQAVQAVKITQMLNRR
jgi:dihydropteroate synthase